MFNGKTQFLPCFVYFSLKAQTGFFFSVRMFAGMFQYYYTDLHRLISEAKYTDMKSENSSSVRRMAACRVEMESRNGGRRWGFGEGGMC